MLQTILTIAGAFGGLELLKWLATLRSSRRKGAAEAADSVENVVAKRLKTYEDSITFLQKQLEDKEKQFAALSARHHEAMERELTLTRRLGEMRLRYRQSRCDRRECPERKPPLRGMKI